MDRLYFIAASTMNYMFLRFVFKDHYLDDFFKEELNIFFNELTNPSSKIPWDFYESCRVELDEGEYLSNYTREEFSSLLSSAVSKIMGENNKVLFQFYSQIADEIYRELEE